MRALMETSGNNSMTALMVDIINAINTPTKLKARRSSLEQVRGGRFKKDRKKMIIDGDA